MSDHLGEPVQLASMVLGQLYQGLVNIPNFQPLEIHSILTFGKFGVILKHSVSPISVSKCDFGTTSHLNCRQKESAGDRWGADI